MADPNTPSTPPTRPPPPVPTSDGSSNNSRCEDYLNPPPVPTSDGSSNNSRCEDYLNELAKALVKAANMYTEADEAARDEGKEYDGFIEVELPGTEYPSMDQLGEASVLAKRSTRAAGKREVPVGKMKLLGLPMTSQVFVRQAAAGHRHGEAAGKVYGFFERAAGPFEDSEPEFVHTGTDGLYGTAITSAPDVAIRSVGLPPNGQPTDNSESGPIFFAEVEDGNRSLPELIRHLGMLFVNFPMLNGVLGIKGMNDGNGNKMNCLVTVEWQRNAAGARVGQPHVTNLIDFGPNAMSNVRKNHVEEALQLPLPPLGARAVAGEHGLGAALPLTGWTRHADGLEAGQPAIVEIPPALLFGGAFSRTEGGVPGVIINIPTNAIPARINLRIIARRYFPPVPPTTV